jgi:nucleoid DNA-binding protein
MHIIPYISQYLQLHKKVAIPGLGVFYLKRVNGFLDEHNHTLYPPSVKLKFEDSEVSENEFAYYISNQTQIDLDKVIYHIEKLLREIKRKVERGSVFLIENIGSLELNRGKIKLVNSENSTFNEDFFGLKSHIYKPFSDGNLITSSNEKFVIELPVVTEEKNQNFSATYSLAEQALNSSSSPEKPKTRNYTWIWILSVFLIFATILGAIVYSFSSLKNIEGNKTPVKKVAKVIHKTAVPVKIDSVSHHEIIIAENLTATKADKIIKKLKTKGIEAHLLIDSLKSVIQISAAQFTDLDSAEANLKIIQQKFYPKAYLKTIKSIK